MRFSLSVWFDEQLSSTLLLEKRELKSRVMCLISDTVYTKAIVSLSRG